MFAIVKFGLRPDTSNHHIRVCACLTSQFVFFSLSDSGVLLSGIKTQVSDSTFSINQSVKNVARNQSAPSSRVLSSQDDPHYCFNKLQVRWKILCDHRDTDLYSYTGPLKTILRRASKSQVSSQNGCSVVVQKLRYHHRMVAPSLG